MFGSGITSNGSNNVDNGLPSGVGGDSIRTQTNNGNELEQDSNLNDHLGP